MATLTGLAGQPQPTNILAGVQAPKPQLPQAPLGNTDPGVGITGVTAEGAALPDYSNTNSQGMNQWASSLLGQQGPMNPPPTGPMAPHIASDPTLNSPVALNTMISTLNGGSIGGTQVAPQQYSPTSWNAAQVNPNLGQVDINAVKGYYQPDQNILNQYQAAIDQINQRGQAAGQEIANTNQFAQSQLGSLPQLYQQNADQFINPQLQAAQQGVANSLAAAGRGPLQDNGSIAALQAAIGANQASRASLVPMLQAGATQRMQAQQGALAENLASMTAQENAQKLGYLQQLSQQAGAAQDYAAQRNAQMGAQMGEFNAGAQNQAGQSNAAAATQAAAANAAARQQAATTNASVRQTGAVTPAALLASPQFKASIGPNGQIQFQNNPANGTPSGLINFGAAQTARPAEGNYPAGTFDPVLGASVSQDPALLAQIRPTDPNAHGGSHDAYIAAKNAIAGLAPNAAMAALAKIKSIQGYPRAVSLAMWDQYHEQALTPDQLSLSQLGR